MLEIIGIIGIDGPVVFEKWRSRHSPAFSDTRRAISAGKMLMIQNGWIGVIVRDGDKALFTEIKT